MYKKKENNNMHFSKMDTIILLIDFKTLLKIKFFFVTKGDFDFCSIKLNILISAIDLSTQLKQHNKSQYKEELHEDER